MSFGNPLAFWLLALIPLILIFGFWSWKIKQDILKTLGLDADKGKKLQTRKYILIAAMIAIAVFVLSAPKLPLDISENTGETGDIIFMADVSGSMGAKKYLDSPSRVERIKPMLYRIIDEFPEARFYPFHFTSTARSITPPLAKEDFPYLKRSIERILDINSAPGRGSLFGEPIMQVLEKIPKDGRVKIIVLFSDGEFFGRRGGYKDFALDDALRKAAEDGVKIVAIGVGEKEGATIPIYDESGKFTGGFEQYENKIFVTSLKEETLQKIASTTNGKYFLEDDYERVIGFLRDNLDDITDESRKNSRGQSYLPIVLIAVLWIVLARFYLK